MDTGNKMLFQVAGSGWFWPASSPKARSVSQTMSPSASKGDEIARNQSVGFVLRIQPVDATGGYCAVADIPDYPPSEITSSY
jgi:hypothetical protein